MFKRSSDDLVDKASDKAKKQRAKLSLVSDGNEKKRSKSSKLHNPSLHNSGVSRPPSTPEGKRPNEKQSLLEAQPAVHRPLWEQSPGQSEIYDLLQAAVAEVGVNLPVPEIVAIGTRSHMKSSLLEALFLGFRFNAGDDEMGTRRPIFFQMRRDSTAVEPKFRFQEENSEKYEGVEASDIASSIKRRTVSHLQEIEADVSAKPIMISAEFAGWSNFTIIDTPDLANIGGKEDASNKVLEIVESLATPLNRLVLFCQHIKQPICPNMLEMLKMLATSRRTMILLFMFQDELQESSEEEVCNLFTTMRKKLAERLFCPRRSIHPFFVAIPRPPDQPKAGVMLCREDFPKQIKLYIGGFNEDRSHILLSCPAKHLISEIDKIYMEKVAPDTLVLLQQSSTEASEKLARLKARREAMSDISLLRESAMRYAHSFCTHLDVLLNGDKDLAPDDLRGFSLDTKSMSFPQLEVNEVRNIALSLTCASTGRIEFVLDKAGAEVARTRAKLGLAPLIHDACDRLKDVLKKLFDRTREWMREKDSQYQTIEHIDAFASFLHALRCSYDNFVVELSKKCKVTVQQRFDSAISTYSYIFNENEDTSDNEESEVPDVQLHQANAIKINPNADVENMYDDICAASEKYLSQIQDLIEKDAPTAFKIGFLKPCRYELPAMFNEHFVKDDDAFKGMFDIKSALETIDKECESLRNRLELVTSCQKHIREISIQLFFSF